MFLQFKKFLNSKLTYPYLLYLLSVIIWLLALFKSKMC